MPPTHLTLLIADLLPPKGFCASPLPPTIDRLIQRAAVSVAPAASLESAVLAAFGWPDTSTGCAPVAALTRLADCGAEQASTWLRADPVHLAVSRDNVQLWDSHVLEPRREEMLAISTTLNAHFADDGYCIDFPDPARGYLRWSEPALVTTPLWQMIGGSVFEHLPQSSVALRRLTNEVQMLLHEHPVNQAREASGKLPINGLWFWGAGELANVPKSPFSHVCARLALARGCALAADSDLTTLGDALELASHSTTQKRLVVLHQATRELRRQSAEGWYAAVAEIERDWLRPAHAGFESGAIESLTLLLPNESASYRISARYRKPWHRLTDAIRVHRALTDFS